MTNGSTIHPAFDADESEALQAIGWRPAPADLVCPDSSLLLATEEGALDDAIAERVHAHVTDCPTCQLLTKDLTQVLAENPSGEEAARIGSRIGVGQSTRRTRPYVYVWLGAGLAAAAAVTFFLLAPPTIPQGPVPDVQVARTTPPAVPSVFVVDRPAIPPGEIDLAVRGETTPADVNNQVALALDRADSGDVKGAIAELEALVRRNPSSRRAGLALGALLLRDARNVEAVASLERARPLKTDPGMDDEVDWYLAIARMRAGDRAGARVLLEAVCKRVGARSVRACAGITEIDRLPSPR